MNNVLFLLIGAVAGFVIGLIVMKVTGKQGLDSSKAQAESILKEANSKAETIIRQADLDGKQAA